MKIRFLIIDDEPLAQRIVEKYAADIPYLEQVGKCSGAFEAMDFLYKNEVDLIFLDINMPKMGGLDFLRSLKNPPIVIITTAYREYALESFDLDVIDYLKKPFAFERFYRAVQKAQEKLQTGGKSKPEKAEIVSEKEKEDFIFVKADTKIHKLNFKDIFYVEAYGDYVKIQLKDKQIVTYSSLKSIAQNLPVDRFFRVHKSYLIAINKIEVIEGNTIKINNNEIPIGKSYKKDFFELINSVNS